MTAEAEWADAEAELQEGGAQGRLEPVQTQRRAGEAAMGRVDHGQVRVRLRLLSGGGQAM